MCLEWSIGFLARASLPSEVAEAYPSRNAALDVVVLELRARFPYGERLGEFDDASFG